ncbi:HK97 family phage prohead protease [Larkinella sp. VNQ87]|uniref:HK97 family phage prohead protease n=1 Tax=Larkinella sp. VNQ87 TaxID=3400921 RepID=UPI003C0A8BAA
MPKKTFRVSDETITCYGVRILNSGLQVESFLANPVMLYMHKRGQVIGKWNNLRLENNEWLAEPEFDTDIELGDQVAGQVDRGFLNAASIVAEIQEIVYNDELKCYDATKSVLQEISIVDVGGNRNALKLVDSRGEYLTDDQAKDFLLKLSNQSQPFKPNEQMSLVAIALACGLAETATQEQITAKVIELKAAAASADGTNYKEKYEQLLKKQKEDQEAKAVKLVDTAISEKRITADQKDTYIKLFAADFALAETVLASIKAPVDLVQLATGGAQQAAIALADDDLVKKYDELDRNGKLVKLMAENRPLFDQIYKAKWGKTYSGK